MSDAHAPLPVTIEPLDHVNRLLAAETAPFRQIHRLIDAVEVLVKLHTVAVVSDYCARARVSPALKETLATGLRTPSLGTWWRFCREFSEQLVRDDVAFFAPGVREFILGDGRTRTLSLKAALDGDDSLVALRNHYAHGATPGDEACRADVDKHLPRYRGLLDSARHLRELRLEEEGGHVHLVSAGTRIDLHPLLVYRHEDKRHYFYNDFKKPHAKFLCYESAAYWRDRGLLASLLERYPIDEWSGLPATDFRRRIEELTDAFRGRVGELERLRAFLDKPRGFMTVWGGPGVGKSALLAEVVRGCSARDGAGSEARPIVIEYFIHRGQQTNTADRFLRDVNRRLEDVIPTGVPQGRGVSEQWECFERRLNEAASRLAGRKLLFVIDGLDEASGGGDLLRYVPRAVPAGVLVIYSSRPLPEVRRIVEELDREHRAEMSLEGLTAADTRAMLYDHVSKYELKHEYIEAVASRSGGNPLFVKMLCEAVAEGRLPLNDTERLPHGMQDLFKGFLARLGDDERAFDTLLVLAVAMDFLSAEAIAAIAEQGVPSTTAAIDRVMEVLVESRLTAAVTGCQLFHESFREYLVNTYPDSVRTWQRRLAEWCGGWSSLAGCSRDYALRYGIRHLEQGAGPGDAEALERMRRRILDVTFRSAQYDAVGLQPVLDDLTRVARRLFLAHGRWQDGLPLLLLHADEARRLRADEAKRLRQLARGGDVAETLAILGREPDGLARLVGSFLTAWELADSGHPFRDVLLDAEKATGAGLPAGSVRVFRLVCERLAERGLDLGDAERLLAGATASEVGSGGV